MRQLEFKHSVRGGGGGGGSGHINVTHAVSGCEDNTILIVLTRAARFARAGMERDGDGGVAVTKIVTSHSIKTGRR